MKINANVFKVITTLILISGMAHANTTPMSKYGVIQNVQNYSSNPFWSPNAPYNQRMPQPVYVTGPEITTDDCLRTVTSLVTTVCAMNNNCIDSQISDIRPAIILQLSRMDTGNYATACGGYIETIFEQYVSRYGNAAPTGVTAFPHATTPNPNANGSDFQIKNPLEKSDPEWADDMMERKQKLQELQTLNGAGQNTNSRAAFPTTYSDLSFTERMANAQAGYEPYKDKRAYTELNVDNIESYDDYVVRQEKITQRKNAYCQSAAKKLASLKSDLIKAKECRASGTQFTECKLQGIY